MHIIFQLFILYFSWQSYTDLIFLFLVLLECRFYSVAAQEHSFACCFFIWHQYLFFVHAGVHPHSLISFRLSPDGTHLECFQTCHQFLAFTLESPIENRAVYLWTRYLLKVSFWEDIWLTWVGKPFIHVLYHSLDFDPVKCYCPSGVILLRLSLALLSVTHSDRTVWVCTVPLLLRAATAAAAAALCSVCPHPHYFIFAYRPHKYSSFALVGG